jgi:hypothetical protein
MRQDATLIPALLDKLEKFHGRQEPCWPVDPYESSCRGSADIRRATRLRQGLGEAEKRGWHRAAQAAGSGTAKTCGCLEAGRFPCNVHLCDRAVFGFPQNSNAL